MKEVILVDDKGDELGSMPILEAHKGTGTLHRAFSVHLFRGDGKVLITKRSEKKLLWPGFWSNSVCSHPLPGESVLDAATRRIKEEAGAQAELMWEYAFRYEAGFGDIGSENEYCHVLTGTCDGELSVDPDEINDVRWVSKEELLKEIDTHPERFTPWSIAEFNHLFRS